MAVNFECAGRRAVFLDRDGVLNRAHLNEQKRPIPPRNVAEFEILPGVPQACAQLKRAGYLLICVTNQPDIARGTADIETIKWINEQLIHLCDLDQLRLCPHDDADRCACRKPKPGMIIDAASEFGLDLAQSYMIGDRYRDVEAGQSAGCRTIFVDYGYPERQAAQAPDLTVASLVEAVYAILT